MKKDFYTIDEYIAAFPKNVQNVLGTRIKVVAPEAEETISYNMPAFKLKGNLVWFVHLNHIGFYPRD